MLLRNVNGRNIVYEISIEQIIAETNNQILIHAGSMVFVKKNIKKSNCNCFKKKRSIF